MSKFILLSLFSNVIIRIYTSTKFSLLNENACVQKKISLETLLFLQKN